MTKGNSTLLKARLVKSNAATDWVWSVRSSWSPLPAPWVPTAWPWVISGRGREGSLSGYPAHAVWRPLPRGSVSQEALRASCSHPYDLSWCRGLDLYSILNITSTPNAAHTHPASLGQHIGSLRPSLLRTWSWRPSTEDVWSRQRIAALLKRKVDKPHSKVLK